MDKIFTDREWSEISHLTRNIAEIQGQLSMLREDLAIYECRLLNVVFGDDYEAGCDLDVIDAETLNITGNYWQDVEQIKIQDIKTK